MPAPPPTPPRPRTAQTLRADGFAPLRADGLAPLRADRFARALSAAGALAIAAALIPHGPALAQTAAEAGPSGLSAALGAQEVEGPVSLIADKVTYDTQADSLTAEGDVEVYYGDRTLTASRVVYYPGLDRIEATGPIMLRGGGEGATVIADFADLDSRLRDGLIRGARALLRDDARFAAAEARRIDGRYNVLSQAVFSPCVVCPEDPTPLWRIRAERIVHDERTRTVHYENATFDVLGTPIAWSPYFRHPDPTLKRASGLLPPIYKQDSNFGQGLKTPYYRVLSDQADVTLTPYLTTDDGLIMEGEYRGEFERGSISLAGSITHQDYDGEDRLRGHVFGAGLYRFGDGLEAGFSIEQASDDGYLRRYDFSDDDRLESELFLRGSDQSGWGEVSLVRFQSLRDDEPFGQIPQAIPTVEGRKVWDAPMGGQFGLDIGGYLLKRTQGQDTAHGFIGVDYEKSWITTPGVQVTAYGDLRADGWRLQDQTGTDPSERSRFGPTLALEARYPLLRRDGEGDWLSGLLGDGPVTHLVEPIAQAVFATYQDDSPAFPNEDSQLVEFDETSLFSLRRHTGWDGFEEGSRLNLGLRYARLGDDGTRFSIAGGRVLRPREIGSFPAGIGLNKRESDFVGAWSLDLPGTVKLAHRMRVGDDLEINRNEVYGSTALAGLELAGSYAWLASDAVTPIDRHEVAAEARYGLTRNWYVGGELQRDLESERWVRTEALVGYANECVDFAVYVGRRFTSTEDVPASTYFGLRVNLWALGAGDGPAAPAAGVCAPKLQ